MTLQLQLRTQEARSQLHAIEKSLDSFKAKLASVDTKPLETRLNKLAAFKGVENSAVNSLDRLANAMDRMRRLGDVSGIAKGLNSLARIRVDAVAANLDRIARALNSFRVPPSMARFANDLAKISASANTAAAGIMKVSRAVHTIKAAPGLSSTARSLERIGASAAGASVGLARFGRVGGTVSSTLAGFGIVLGGIGIARFVESTLGAVTAVDAFKNTIAATQGGMAAANREWEFVNKTADALKISIAGTAESYGKFSAAAHLAGVSTADVHKIFTSMSEAARVLKLDQEQVSRSFLALEQMFSKGTVGAEELRQQLGDHLPGAMQLMAKAVGVSTGELMKMMKSGEVLASSALPKFADVLHQQFGGQVPAALHTAQAAMENFKNAMFRIREAFGRGLFGEDFQASVDGLANALNRPDFINGVRAWGSAIGTFASAATSALRLVTENFSLLKVAVLGFVGVKLGTLVGGWATALIAMGTQAATVTRTVAGMTVTIGTLWSVAGFGTALRTAFFAAAAGARTFMLSLGPVGLAIAALTVGVPVLLDLYHSWAGASGQAANANEALANAAQSAGRQEQFAANAAKLATGAMNSASSSARGLAGNFNVSAAAARNAAAAYQQAAAAARAAAASAASAATRGSVVKPSADEAYRRYLNGPLYGEVFAGGGIVGKPTFRPRHRVPASAFIGAPHFADGGLTGGGIPAVLHPNEAVVPLAGGGTIPVQNVSGGQSALLLYKPLMQLLDISRQIKVSVERVWEATTVQTSLTKNALDRIQFILESIQGPRITDIINSLSSIVTAIQGINVNVNVSGGGASGGGGLDGGSAFGAGAGGSNLSRVGAMFGGGDRNAVSQFNQNTGFNITTFPDGSILRTINYGGFGKARALSAETTTSSGTGGFFASGSPNAFKDLHGGFQATLHPDEAVIPLPDGRSVPVTFQSDVLDRISDFMTDRDDRMMSATLRSEPSRLGVSAAPNITVNMVVNTKDADSFRASRDQLMRELSSDIDRALRRTGRKSDIDDPTRRL